MPINDSSVSRKHGSIEREDGRFLLQDFKSTDGVLVNDEFIEVPIRNHENTIRIEKTVLQFLEEELY